MIDCLTTDTDNAIAITSVSKQSFADWLEQHPAQREWLQATGFMAEPGSFSFLPGDGGRPSAVLASPFDDAPVWAHAGLPMSLPEGRYRLETGLDGEAAAAAALGWALGAYAFTAYRKPKRSPAQLVWPKHADRAEVERIAHAVTLTRDLINTPAEDMGPDHLAQAARSIAERHGATIAVIRGEALLEQNYPTIHAVGRASTRPPCLIDLRWGDAGAPRVSLVGKGVCFDTGGLDIKPAAGMLEMKKDMGGAAVTLGLADALMSAGLPIRLRVLVPAVENSISGGALRPRDIVRTRAGKTVEIGNTDAEGRLVLCDALAEADTEKPALLIDCATLTGAARIALGPEVQALFCDDDALAEGLLKAGLAAGDPLWRLPIWRGYRKLIDGKCADLNNVATGNFAGAIIGALYLSEFVSRETPWAHMDIMAANTAARPGRPEGGEATGLRAIYGYLKSRFS